MHYLYAGGRYTEKDAGEYGFNNSILWVTWHNRWYSLKETTMKLIPLSRITAGGQQAGVKQFGGLEMLKRETFLMLSLTALKTP